MGNCCTSMTKNVQDDGHSHKQDTIQAEMIKVAAVEISQVAPVLEADTQAGDECEKMKMKMKMLRVQEKRNNDGDDDVDKNGNNGCDGGGGGGGGGGAMRIRLMVTKKELKQILNMRKDLKFSSVEDLLKALRLRDRRRRQSLEASFREYSRGPITQNDGLVLQIN